MQYIDGRNNSILFSRVKEKQPDVFSIGYVCYLADLSLKAGVKELTVDIDDFFVDLYFGKSTKRKEMYHEFEELLTQKS